LFLTRKSRHDFSCGTFFNSYSALFSKYVFFGHEILSRIFTHKFVLTPGRYLGIPDEVDDGVPIEDKMKSLTGQLKEQMEEARRLDVEIKKQLSKVGFKI